MAVVCWQIRTCPKQGGLQVGICQHLVLIVCCAKALVLGCLLFVHSFWMGTTKISQKHAEALFKVVKGIKLVGYGFLLPLLLLVTLNWACYAFFFHLKGTQGH